MRKGSHNALDGLLALLLFGVFAACVLSVLLTGANAYQRLTLRDRISYDRRTAAQYLATRVRQADQLYGVTLAVFDGEDALELTESIDGVPYVTRIYCYDGCIRELFTAADGDFQPSDGEKIMEAQALSFDWLNSGRLLEATLTNADGAVTRILLSLRSGEGAAA